MKILHVYAQKPDHTGSGVYIQNLIKNLHSQGISNYLICATSVSDDIDKDLLQALDKIDMINFDTKDLPFPIPGMSDDMPYKSSIYSKLSEEELNLWQNAFNNSLKKAKAYKPDKIIVHHLWGLVPLVLDNFDSKLVTAICHGTDMRQLKLFKHLNNANIDFIENILSSIQKLSDIIALNDIQKQAIINNYKVDSHKIRTIGLGFNPNLFFPEKLPKPTNNEFEMSEENGKIAALWEEYFANDVYKKTFDKANSDFMYGVYSNYESDASGNYKVTVGVEVTKPKNAIVIENKKYLVFTKQGELPMVVVELWEEIWDYFEKNNEYERSFEIDFEKYTKEDEIEIYVSIK